MDQLLFTSYIMKAHLIFFLLTISKRGDRQGKYEFHEANADTPVFVKSYEDIVNKLVCISCWKHFAARLGKLIFGQFSTRTVL